MTAARFCDNKKSVMKLIGMGEKLMDGTLKLCGVAALGLALGLEPEACLAFTMENCSVTRIDHIDGPGMGHGWRVVTVNRPPR